LKASPYFRTAQAIRAFLAAIAIAAPMVIERDLRASFSFSGVKLNFHSAGCVDLL
jgi:hypothetical protein